MSDRRLFANWCTHNRVHAGVCSKGNFSNGATTSPENTCVNGKIPMFVCLSFALVRLANPFELFYVSFTKHTTSFRLQTIVSDYLHWNECITICIEHVSGEQLFKWKVPKITIDTHIRQWTQGMPFYNSLSFAALPCHFHAEHTSSLTHSHTEHPNGKRILFDRHRSGWKMQATKKPAQKWKK